MIVDIEEISVQEAAKALHKGEQFVRQAVINGSLPGAYAKVGNRTNFFIPKKAFYDFAERFVRKEKEPLPQTMTQEIK